MPIDRFNVGARMSQVVVHGDTVYIAGQVADDSTASVEDQVRQTLAKIERLLSQAGTDKSHLLSATVWLDDYSNYDRINAIWDAWVTPGNPPVRACIGSTLGQGYEIEIAAIAARS